MTFSKQVKEELAEHISSARHCRLSELAALISVNGKVSEHHGKPVLRFQTESYHVARKYFTLIRKAFNINIDVSVKGNENAKRTYFVLVKEESSVRLILQACKLMEENYIVGEQLKVNGILVQRSCCKRAFIRGVYLTSGSISDPEKTYHLEIVLSDLEKAKQVQEIINTFSMDAKIVERKKHYVVYLKEGSQIVDLLNVMEAHVSLMNLENVRIVKEMRNSINRQVNCEAANITKTVTAATKQMNDIIYIRDHLGFGNLEERLEEIAELRILHPESSLKELGEMLDPQIGKSGVNHRLKKLSSIAEKLRESKEDIRV